MWQVHSNFFGGTMPPTPPVPPLAPYYLNMTYSNTFTMSGIHSSPTVGYRGPFYRNGIVGNTDGAYSPYFNVTDSKIQAYFTCVSAGDLFPAEAGSFVLDVEDVSIPSFYHTGYSPWYTYPPGGTFVEVVAYDSTHFPSNKIWYEHDNPAWLYTPWATQHDVDKNNMVEIPGNTYSRKKVVMPKFTFPARYGVWKGGIAFRFFNYNLRMDPPTGISQWQIYGLYWRTLDLVDHLIWAP